MYTSINNQFWRLRGDGGRDGTIQCVGPRILQAERACYMALLDVTYIFFFFLASLFSFLLQKPSND